MLAVRSYSTQETAVGKVFAEELATLGFDVEHDGWGNVIGTLRLGPGPTVLLDGHLDTVEVTDPAHWTRNPLGELDDGRIYGRGAVDMKGPLAACAYGAASLARENAETLSGTIVVTGSVAEELAEGPALTHIIEGLAAEGNAPDVVVICEPSANQLMLGQRGRAEIVIEILGVPCHSAYPEAGVNAAEVMADVITALRGLEPQPHPELGRGILALTDLKSFPYPSQSMVPDRCLATFDRRTLTGESAEDVLSAVRRVAEETAGRRGAAARVSLAQAKFTTATGVDVGLDVFAPAWLMPVDSPSAAAAAAGLHDTGLGTEPGYYKFCTNGSASAGKLLIPTLGYGPGDPDQAHTVDESISVDDLRRGARGYAAIIGALLSQQHPNAIPPAGFEPDLIESEIP